jgi:hypothetical protein
MMPDPMQPGSHSMTGKPSPFCNPASLAKHCKLLQQDTTLQSKGINVRRKGKHEEEGGSASMLLQHAGEQGRWEISRKTSE